MESLIVLSIASYLIGSIPTGYLLAKTFGKHDLSKKGSKNIGATNAYRVAGKAVGVATLIADLAKGVIAILLARQLNSEHSELLAGIFVILGHIFPVWLRFKGGKGVATSLAVFTMIDLRLGFIAFGSFVIMFLFFRIVAVASMTAALTTSVIGAFLVSGDIAYMVIFISILIFWRHRENVVRILEGKEKKI
jgi:glycerol-3-phosphate acyltransferase PlsY